MEVYLLKSLWWIELLLSKSRVNDVAKTSNEKKTEEEVMNDYKVEVVILWHF